MDAADDDTDITFECATLASAGAGGRCTPPSVIVLALVRGGGSCDCAEWTTVPPTDLRAGTLGAFIVVPGFALSFLVICRVVDVDAGMGSTEEIDERTLFRLGRSGAGGALLQVTVGAAGAVGTCILLFFGRRNWRTGACGAAMGYLV
ncbi:hypothetical protein DFH94DRAFT_712952 [Russula ochroleuca]|uniref:Uncharacterized protein n=1 Tax=Russula ochroleuca TaxID=152965 RepID=A0A9P5TDF9_9AGAM|nr:hypothetical protein DFH94DRAFT_788777 [Russula ochroleuca]KAF8486376.1 hypothetical protein DFH94DRAFT_712952 [Russula ochroleuca]